MSEQTLGRDIFLNNLYRSNKWIGCASITQDTNEVGFLGTTGDQVYLTPCDSLSRSLSFSYMLSLELGGFLRNPLKAITGYYIYGYYIDYDNNNNNITPPSSFSWYPSAHPP